MLNFKELCARAQSVRVCVAGKGRCAAGSVAVAGAWRGNGGKKAKVWWWCGSKGKGNGGQRAKAARQCPRDSSYVRRQVPASAREVCPARQCIEHV